MTGTSATSEDSLVRFGTAAISVVLVSSLLGCSGDDFAAIPAVEGAKVVVAFWNERGAARIELRALQDEVRFEAIDAEASGFALAYYAADLQALDLVPGPLEEAPVDACLSGTLGTPLAVQRLESDGSGFKPLEVVPEALSTFRFSRPCPCAPLAWSTVTIPPGLHLGSLAPAGPSSVYALFFNRGVFEIDLDGNEEELISFDVGATYTHLCSGPDRALYLAGAQGRFARWTRDGGLEALAPYDPGADERPSDLLCFERSGRTELLVHRLSQRDIVRFDGASWSVVYEGTGSALTADNRGTLIRLADGRFFTAPEDGAELVDLDQDLRPLQVTPWLRDADQASGPLQGVAESKAFGLVMLTRIRNILHREELAEEWKLLAQQTEASADKGPVGVVPFHDGALSFGHQGTLRELHPQVGACPPITTLSRLKLERSTILPGSGAIILGSAQLDTAAEVLVIVTSEP